SPLGRDGHALADTDFALARYDSGLAPPQDFTIACDPSTLTIKRGKSATVGVTIARTGGFDGAVTVTPPDVAAEKLKLKPPSPQPTPGDSVSLKLKVKNPAAAGDHSLVFEATDGDERHREATLVVTVQ